MDYIKLSNTDAESLEILVDEEMIKALPHLNLVLGDNIAKYLLFQVIDNFTYIIMGLYDLSNKCRMTESSDVEKAMWENKILENGWEVVEGVPVKGDL